MRAQGQAVPILRYFVSVGCALLALLLFVNWYWAGEPKVPGQQASTESPVEQTIRIQSERRWPDKIEFDTTQPTIVPSPTPVIIAPQPPAPMVAANSPLDARAEVKPAARPAPPPKRQARARHRYPRPDPYGRPPTFASANPMAPSWPFGNW
jgi:hypothetical protein